MYQLYDRANPQRNYTQETQPISDELQENPHEQLSFGILLSYLQQGQTPAQSLKSIESQFPGPIEYHAFIAKVGRFLRSELIIATAKRQHSSTVIIIGNEALEITNSRYRHCS